MCFAQAGGRRNLGRGPVRQRMNDRGGEQKCKAVANRLRKIRRVPAERIPLTPSRAHATPQSNASFETKHRPPAVFPELLSFTQRRATNVTLRELNREGSSYCSGSRFGCEGNAGDTPAATVDQY